jgi:regulator of protease activity HflC (stomatin/prohibitin superfamily)
MPKIVSISIALVVGVFILTIITPFGIISPGERGVVINLGNVTGDLKDDGPYFRIPIYQRIQKMSVQIQKVETEATAASKDLQTVNATVALNFSLEEAALSSLYEKVGDEKTISLKLLNPSLQDGIKAVTARFTAEELISRRPEVSSQMRDFLRDRLSPYGITVGEINIVNFQFSPSFDQAIEAKVTAEQEALASKNKLEQTKYEAQQQIESAKGKAEALRIEGDALRSNQQLLELRAIEKWNGDVPTYWGGTALPFINVQ